MKGERENFPEENFPEAGGEEENIQDKGYQRPKGAEMGSMECAEKVPQGPGFQVGVAREATTPQAFRGEVKEFIFPQ